jgi:phospholipid/cholesterol/gamma-HCH transport system ATP-binding protein
VSGLVLRNAWFGFGDPPVLRGTELTMEKGNTVVITGPNGCGKSTLLYACAGLIHLHRGSVELGGHRADAYHPSDLFRAGVRCGFVFQEGGLLANMNAIANVALALRYHADIIGLTDEQIDERVLSVLDRVKIRKADHFSLPAHLSFGVRKRLALARAIALMPTFFFFDDPDVGLDPATATIVHEILCGYRDDPEVTVLVATNRDLLIDRLGVAGYDMRDGALSARSRRLA